MKIEEAKKAYSAQLDTLQTQKRALTTLLKENPQTPNFDRVDISRELSTVEAQYEATQKVMAGIQARETGIHNAEAARQQAEAAAEAATELTKILEIYRRIASGGQVPPKDEQKLMEYDMKLYMAAKMAALTAQNKGEEYDTLWPEEEEESDGEETASASEIAANTEISVPTPEAVAAAATVPAPEA